MAVHRPSTSAGAANTGGSGGDSLLRMASPPRRTTRKPDDVALFRRTGATYDMTAIDFNLHDVKNNRHHDPAPPQDGVNYSNGGGRVLFHTPPLPYVYRSSIAATTGGSSSVAHRRCRKRITSTHVICVLYLILLIVLLNLVVSIVLFQFRLRGGGSVVASASVNPLSAFHRLLRVQSAAANATSVNASFALSDGISASPLLTTTMGISLLESSASSSDFDNESNYENGNAESGKRNDSGAFGDDDPNTGQGVERGRMSWPLPHDTKSINSTVQKTKNNRIIINNNKIAMEVDYDNKFTTSGNKNHKITGTNNHTDSGHLSNNNDSRPDNNTNKKKDCMLVDADNPGLDEADSYAKNADFPFGKSHSEVDLVAAEPKGDHHHRHTGPIWWTTTNQKPFEWSDFPSETLDGSRPNFFVERPLPKASFRPDVSSFGSGRTGGDSYRVRQPDKGGSGYWTELIRLLNHHHRYHYDADGRWWWPPTVVEEENVTNNNSQRPPQPAGAAVQPQQQHRQATMAVSVNKSVAESSSNNSSNNKGVVVWLDCGAEAESAHGAWRCAQWRAAGFCRTHPATRYLFCRRECHCVDGDDASFSTPS